EKERQRLESLRKKQEAEEQRRRKVEEEKLRRQAEMKQKREERLRKALQARERVEQMEEEKKKRMEQKILQSDERVREEKVLEERSKKKLSKKLVEASAWRQKVLRGVRAAPARVFCFQEEEGLQQQEPLRRRRENEGKERGNRVLELKNLVEQRQAEQMERCWSRRGSVGLLRVGGCCGPRAAPRAGAAPQQSCCEPREVGELECGSQGAEPSRRGLARPLCSTGSRQGAGVAPRLSSCWCLRRPEVPTMPGPGSCLQWCCFCFQKSASYLGPLKGTRDLRHPKVSENNYGMDLNSDDSTDDENEPRKPVPAWAGGSLLNEAIVHQYYHPVDVDQIFGLIPMPRLEDIFGKSKPRYFKRTSSAVWHSPP
ncbi:INCEA protein, partial [Rhinopomastus cyanomelas]|nr:INCEA protein [Rhinopomastus cyanomelas]